MLPAAAATTAGATASTTAPTPAAAAAAAVPNSPLNDLLLTPFPQEIVSVIPPVVLQARSPYTDCDTQIPGLSNSVMIYFENQAKKKCSTTYDCDFPNKDGKSAFRCIDREHTIPPQETYFNRESISLRESSRTGGSSSAGGSDASSSAGDGNVYGGSSSSPPSADADASAASGTSEATRAIEVTDEDRKVATTQVFYPEFADMLTIDTVYRGGNMIDTRSYIDMQTSKITIWNVFLVPSRRLGTILSVDFEYAGPGILRGSYSLSSFVQMDTEAQSLYLHLALASVCLCIVDLMLLVGQVFGRFRQRRRWVSMVVSDRTVARRNMWKIRRAVSKHIPLFGMWDVFDVLLRVLFIVYTGNHFSHYYSPDLESTGRGRFEDVLNRILLVPWTSEEVKPEQNVSDFFTIVREFSRLLQVDVTLRTSAYVLVLVGFVRLVAYLRVHPRVAVLYKTLETAMDDLFHFFIV